MTATASSDRVEEHRSEILLIGHTAAHSAVRCERCQERNAFWRLRGADGHDRMLCPYCAALETGDS